MEPIKVGGAIDILLKSITPLFQHVPPGKDRIVVVHFNDMPNIVPEQIRDDQRLLPGEGVINLSGFLQALEKTGFRIR